MGLLTGLLTLPLAPVRAVAWIGEQVAQQAEYERGGGAERASRRLAGIEAAWEAGEITDEDRAELEAEVLDDLLTEDAEDW